uniref:Uncharacterized protein n=1 Tax=Caenorhabditis japonica TaxID=281687 RepID=A0A8R1E3I2_CAEJA
MIAIISVFQYARSLVCSTASRAPKRSFAQLGQHSNHASHLSSLRATTLSRHGPSITIGTTEYAPSCQITVCASTAANLYAATSHRTFQKDTTRLSTRAAIKGGQSNHSGAVCVTIPSSTFYTCFGSRP